MSRLSCLTSCGFLGRPERPIWRTQAENACFARKQVALSDTIVAAPEIDGPGVCGMTRPLKVSALADGSVAVDKTLTIDCPMIPALEAWLNAIVEPDAEARFGQKVATVNVFGAYSCRGIDNMPGARLSEHAFGNAVDVAGFTLADGRRIDFVHDWKSAGTQEAAFLHEAHAGACQYFTTVLGPGADVFHYNHIHLDLANHGSTDTGPRRICKPTPAPDLLPAPAAARRPAARAQYRRAARHRAFERADAPAAPPPPDASPGPTGRRTRRRFAAGADRRKRSRPADPACRRLSERRPEPDLVDPRPRRLEANPTPRGPKRARAGRKYNHDAKSIQIKSSEKAWISLVLFVRIGTFQRVTGEKIKKSTRVSGCVQNVSNAFPFPSTSPPAGSQAPHRGALRPPGSPLFASNSDIENK